MQIEINQNQLDASAHLAPFPDPLAPFPAAFLPLLFFVTGAFAPFPTATAAAPFFTGAFLTTGLVSATVDFNGDLDLDTVVLAPFAAIGFFEITFLVTYFKKSINQY